jgi:hypothetical protein
VSELVDDVEGLKSHRRTSMLANLWCGSAMAEKVVSCHSRRNKGGGELT